MPEGIEFEEEYTTNRLHRSRMPNHGSGDSSTSRLFITSALICMALAAWIIAYYVFGVGQKQRTIINNITPEMLESLPEEARNRLRPAR